MDYDFLLGFCLLSFNLLQDRIPIMCENLQTTNSVMFGWTMISSVVCEIVILVDLIKPDTTCNTLLPIMFLLIRRPYLY